MTDKEEKIMQYIYFDWNVFQDIKQETKAEYLTKIDEAKRTGFLFPYSEAHIRDLLKSKNEEENIKDLKFINLLTDKRCLRYESEFIIDYYDSLNLYEDIQSNTNTTYNSTKIFSFNPYKIDITKIEKDNLFYEYLIKNNNTMTSDLLEKIINDSFNKIFDDNNYFKMFRKSIQNIPKLLELSKLHDFFDNKFIIAMEKDKKYISENFIEIFKDFLKLSDKTIDKIPYGEKITTAYRFLDNLPAFSEKISKKNGVSNISNDGLHCWYASNAKYFVTNDSKMLEKTELVFLNFKIKTKIKTKTEFLNILFT